MRYISKRFNPPARKAKQLELVIGDMEKRKRIDSKGLALSLAVAGGVCLVTATMIHRTLLMIVGPVGVGLLGGATTILSRNKKRKETCHEVHSPLGVAQEYGQDSRVKSSDVLQATLKIFDGS